MEMVKQHAVLHVYAVNSICAPLYVRLNTDAVRLFMQGWASPRSVDIVLNQLA